MAVIMVILIYFKKIKNKETPNEISEHSMDQMKSGTGFKVPVLTFVKGLLEGQPDRISSNIDLKRQTHNMSYDTKREIDRSSFTIDDEIGRGTFGKVYKGTLVGLYDPQSTTSVAIKSIHTPGYEKDLNDLMGEIKIMSRIEPHLNLVSMIGSSTTELKEHGKLYLLIEYCEYGDLRNYLINNKAKILSGNPDDVLNSRCLIRWAYDIAKGMQYLSENRIMHGDLATRNVLMGEGFSMSECPVPKVADFGLAKNFYDKTKYAKENRLFVPWKWMALEYLLDEYFTLKSDVWSYAVLIWEMLSFGRDPYGKQDYDEVLPKLENGYRLPCPKDTDWVSSWSPKTLYKILSEKCFVENPEKRATFSDVVQIIEKLLHAEEKTQYTEKEKIYQETRAKNYLRIGRRGRKFSQQR